MALLNNLYIHVTEEKVNRTIDSTSHAVEKGLNITDTIKSQPVEISLTGKIVNVGKVKAGTIISKIGKLMKSGSLVKYKGRNQVSNMQIQSFDRTHSNENSGCCDFEMTLKQVRIAKPSYKTKSKKKRTTPTAKIKVGSKVVFAGGSVYASSTAKKPSRKLNKSTCKVIAIKDGKYKIKSVDGGKVNAWVKKSQLKAVSKSSTKSKVTGTLVQVTTGSKKSVYHKVKKGEKLYTLVNKNYKSLGKTMSWVMQKNPKCFRKKGDASSLIVGSKLLMGYKS